MMLAVTMVVVLPVTVVVIMFIVVLVVVIVMVVLLIGDQLQVLAQNHTHQRHQKNQDPVAEKMPELEKCNFFFILPSYNAAPLIPKSSLSFFARTVVAARECRQKLHWGGQSFLHHHTE